MGDLMTAVAPSATPDAAGRAAEPRAQGYLDRDGVRISTSSSATPRRRCSSCRRWAINHSRFWKGQVPYLSRHFSVLTFDAPRQWPFRPAGVARTNTGRRSRPQTPSRCSTSSAWTASFLVVHCGSADKGLLLTANHPERFVGAVFMSPALPITPPRPERVMSFTEPLPIRRRLGEAEPPLLAARLSRLPGLLLRTLLHGAALHEADRGRHRLGARDDTGHARAHGETGRIRRGDVA